MQKIKIEVVSDVVCPWCFIGKRRLEKAMQQLTPQIEFEVTYSPFELNPTVPPSGYNQKEYLTRKFGGAEAYARITQHVTSVAATEGLRFNFDQQLIAPNTRTAHRIIWLAQQYNRNEVVKEAFLKAYFEDGVNLSNPDNLVQIAVQAGLPADRVQQLLNSDEGLQEVIASEQLNQQRGVSGVPFYIINNQYGISGAQPAEVFVQAFTELGKETEASLACDVEGQDC